MKRSKEAEARLFCHCGRPRVVFFHRETGWKKRGLIAPIIRTMWRVGKLASGNTGAFFPAWLSFRFRKRSDLVLWSLWSRNREGPCNRASIRIKTALSIYDLIGSHAGQTAHDSSAQVFGAGANIPSIVGACTSMISSRQARWRSGRATG